MKDADAAIDVDAEYAKAYLRRAAACTALDKFDEAVRDYQKVCMLLIMLHVILPGGASTFQPCCACTV